MPVLPKDATDQVQYEGELVAVIGKRCKRVSEAEALDCVFGYTIGNDVSERTWQRGDRTFWRGKNTDTFKPMGPWIVTGLDPDALRVTIRLNGREMFSYAASYFGDSDAQYQLARLYLEGVGVNKDPRQALRWQHPYLKGITFERLEREGSIRLSVPDPFAPFAQGGFPTPSGKCELFSESMAQQGLDPVPAYVAPRESVKSAPELARRYPLAFISPPAHHFLNSTFSAQPVFVRRESGPSLTIHPEDAEARGIADGQMVRTFNDRGAFLAKARVSDDARPGVVVGLSVWWAKMCPGGRNANAVTSQELTDMGGGATFYDALVDVAPA